ncbi:hypothetical protein NDI56_13990 [Haloarcula sp. S1CR25-12]|uniref:Phage tail assembly protein n=1 Tax=Haloarcula saliterrae TaxID=2950534 RepID=A0ABU2FE58_9EURY|nr:hypothetical protein [Haloarcula sp. S1CR25-12]MDS0260512.1 hypothetical protein [Haloarcula sp. S1CR25-12]
MTDQTLQTEFEFSLPQGYVDDEGTLHKEGRMRLATAADEITPLKEPRVQSNSSYLTIVLLARTVTELGSLDTVDEAVIQNLFVSDLEYLQAMYERVNNGGLNAVDTACPDCGEPFTVEVETGAHIDESAGPGQSGESEQVLPIDDAGATDADTQFRDISQVSDGETEHADAGNPAE